MKGMDLVSTLEKKVKNGFIEKKFEKRS